MKTGTTITTKCLFWLYQSNQDNGWVIMKSSVYDSERNHLQPLDLQSAFNTQSCWHFPKCDKENATLSFIPANITWRTLSRQVFSILHKHTRLPQTHKTAQTHKAATNTQGSTNTQDNENIEDSTNSQTHSQDSSVTNTRDSTNSQDSTKWQTH